MRPARLSATRRSTAALSAPSCAAGYGRWWRCGAQCVSARRRHPGVGGGDGGHRHLDQFTAAAGQRFGHGQRGVQARQRVGDGVAAEHRPVVVPADQAAGHRGVVAERHPVGALAVGAVAGDPQPDPAVARRDVRGAETATGQRRGPRRLDHHVGGREQRPQPGRVRRNRRRTRAFRRSSSRRTRPVRPGCRRAGPGSRP